MGYMERHLLWVMMIILSTVSLMGAFMIYSCSAEVQCSVTQNTEFQNVTELRDFLKLDTTNNKSYVTPWHMCGDFTDDLIYNASIEGKIINRVLISDCPVYLSLNNHIIASTVIKGKTYYIEPQQDTILIDPYFSRYGYYMEFETQINPLTFALHKVKYY